jgi:hypothetical protein
MSSRRFPRQIAPAFVLLIGVVFADPLKSSAEPGQVLQPNTSIVLNGHTVTLTKLEDLPFVESEYTKRFKFDSADNPKLKELRDRYKLDEVVGPGKTSSIARCC